MTGSITAVFSACAAATGRPFQAPQRGVSARCPLHGDKRASLIINESRGIFKCLSASCVGSSKSASMPGHGIVDAPIAFGIVTSRRDSARWLSERGLIPPSDPSLAGERTIFVTPREYTDTNTLTFAERMLRTEALLELDDLVGNVRLRAVRDHIAEMRAPRNAVLRAAYPIHSAYCAIGQVLVDQPELSSEAVVARARELYPDLTAALAVAL